MKKSNPDPAKMYSYWMEWERGELTPGELIKNLKISGMKELLESMSGTEENS